MYKILIHVETQNSFWGGGGGYECVCVRTRVCVCVIFGILLFARWILWVLSSLYSAVSLDYVRTWHFIRMTYYYYYNFYCYRRHLLPPLFFFLYDLWSKKWFAFPDIMEYTGHKKYCLFCSVFIHAPPPPPPPPPPQCYLKWSMFWGVSQILLVIWR